MVVYIRQFQNSDISFILISMLYMYVYVFFICMWRLVTSKHIMPCIFCCILLSVMKKKCFFNLVVMKANNIKMKNVLLVCTSQEMENMPGLQHKLQHLKIKKWKSIYRCRVLWYDYTELAGHHLQITQKTYIHSEIKSMLFEYEKKPLSGGMKECLISTTLSSK